VFVCDGRMIRIRMGMGMRVLIRRIISVEVRSGKKEKRSHGW
jgi:hypothetical protein